MKNDILKAVVLGIFIFVFVGCGKNTDVVESGTYEGMIQEIDPSKPAIYVVTTGHLTLGLDIRDQTELTRNGNNIDFSAFEEGQKVEVEVEKVGDRMETHSVRILN